MLNKTALIADDDDFFRIALREILTARLRFAEVVETASLDEALEQLSERPDIPLALFDLAMPGMESPASLEAVRECFPSVRVAVVSASNRRRDILSALDAGVHGYVPKGLGVDRLSDALRKIEAGQVYVPASLANLPAPTDTNEQEQIARSDSPMPQLYALTPRQRQVLKLVVQGKSNKEIARALCLGEGTVKVHMAALFRILAVSSRSAAAVAGAKILSD